MNKELPFSSKKDSWGTPWRLYRYLNAHHKFDIDICASEFNTKHKMYYTEENDALSKDWDLYNSIWCNPPYGDKLGKWIEKALASRSATIMLLPSSTCTAWFRTLLDFNVEIEFLTGRVYFEDSKRKQADPARFPSILVYIHCKKVRVTPQWAYQKHGKDTKDTVFLDPYPLAHIKMINKVAKVLKENKSKVTKEDIAHIWREFKDSYLKDYKDSTRELFDKRILRIHERQRGKRQ